MSQVKKKFLANGAIAKMLNNTYIQARNSANDADVNVIMLNGNDKVEVAADLIGSNCKLGSDLTPWTDAYILQLFGGNGNKVIDMSGGSRLFYDQGGSTISIDADARLLKDSAGFTSIDFSGATDLLISKHIDMGAQKIKNLADPTALDEAATKNYVDTEISGIDLSAYLVKTGDTMSGNLAMGGNKVTGLAAASANGEALRYDELGANNGIATLDAGGKVPVSQLPSSLMTYEGTWDASTNTPTLADGTGDAGQVYIVSVAGSQDLGSGSISFAIGDWVIYNGTVWEKSSNSNAVVSVNSQTGVVVLDSDDISEGVTNKYQKAWGKEALTLVAGDITNQYVDLAETILANSLDFVVSGLVQREGVDYTVSLTGGSGGVTRVSFAGDLATGGGAELVATDVIYLKYQY